MVAKLIKPPSPLLQPAHPRPVVFASVARAAEVVFGQTLSSLILANCYKRLTVGVNNLLTLSNGFAGKAEGDPTPGDTVVVGVAPVVDQRQGGVGRSTDLLQAVVRPAGACLLNLSCLMGVVEGDPHKVVE